MRWFTCTPVEFGGGPDFFGRDSGLLSRGFRAIGVESRAVMPGDRRPDDLEELIRTDHANLESARWWRDLEIDGVVLYAWGRPRFRRVAGAIREAGVRLVLNQDSSGLVSPRWRFGAWLDEQGIVSGRGRVRGGGIRFLQRVAKGLTVGLAITDPLRSAHLKLGDWITAVSPIAADRYRELCFGYGGEALRDRVAFVPHPVDPMFVDDGSGKDRRIVAVGRWNDEIQKRSSLLKSVVGRLVETDSGVVVDLVGPGGELLAAWWKALPEAHRSRVLIHGRLDPVKIAGLMQRAQVSYCPSAFESFHIASAEALCCGCTVVAGRSVSLASFEWFVSDGDGCLAEAAAAEAHLVSLEAELGAWSSGRRAAEEISKRWSARLHAPKVAERILGLFDGVQNR